MSARILILYTGGTVGMMPSEEGYVPMPGLQQRLQKYLGDECAAQLPEYDLVEFAHLIDSANLEPSDWTRIAQELAHNWRDYDGFVVLHGTDTMAYTASALSFMLRGIDKPVILTGSQIPLGQLRNDALDNLIGALLLAANRQIAEVCLYFNGRLLRGNRARKVRSAGFDAFDSPNYPWLAQVGIEIDVNAGLLLPPGKPDFQIPVFDPEAVVVLSIYPGFPARLIDAALDAPNVRGLILHTYGVGNPPDANNGLIAALSRASERGIAILNLTQCHQGAVSQGAYATGATLNRLGVIPGHDLTPEAAFAKLHLLLATGVQGEALHQALTQPLCGECTG